MGGIIGPYFFKDATNHNVNLNSALCRNMISNFYALFIGEFGQHFRKPLKCKCLIWNSIFQKSIKLIIEKIKRIYYYRLRRTPDLQKKKNARCCTQSETHSNSFMSAPGSRKKLGKLNFSMYFE